MNKNTIKTMIIRLLNSIVIATICVVMIARYYPYSGPSNQSLLHLLYFGSVVACLITIVPFCFFIGVRTLISAKEDDQEDYNKTYHRIVSSQ